MPVRRLSLVVVLALVLLALPASPVAARTMENMPVAVLRAIDKVSARTVTFDVPVDKTVKFGRSLFIKPRACRKASQLDAPESAAFLQVWEKKPDPDNGDEKAEWVFSGWMFASSPGLSAMDHAVYDVWVIDCKNASAKDGDKTSFSDEKAPDGGAEPAALPDDETGSEADEDGQN